MFTHFKNSLVVFSVLVLLSSCIGTDLVDGLIGPNLSSFELLEKEFVLSGGETAVLTTVYRDAAGNEATIDLTWSSNDNNIATVDNTGQVTAINTGQTNITVTTADGKTDEALVTVIEDQSAIASIAVSASTAILEVGENAQLSATIRNGAGDAITTIVPTWTSSNPAVVQVDANTGAIAALAIGLAEITASAEGINSLPFEITVSTGALSGDFIGQTGHTVSGTATLTQNAEGKNIVVLEENFSTQSGPGLYVYFGQSATSGTNGVAIDELKATSGTQTYVIPDNVDVNNYSHVLIYCQPFSIVFGSAELK